MFDLLIYGMCGYLQILNDKLVFGLLVNWDVVGSGYVVEVIFVVKIFDQLVKDGNFICGLMIWFVNWDVG